MISSPRAAPPSPAVSTRSPLFSRCKRLLSEACLCADFFVYAGVNAACDFIKLSVCSAASVELFISVRCAAGLVRFVWLTAGRSAILEMSIKAPPMS